MSYDPFSQRPPGAKDKVFGWFGISTCTPKEWILRMFNRYARLTAEDVDLLWDNMGGIAPRRPKFDKLCWLMRELVDEGKIFLYHKYDNGQRLFIDRNTKAIFDNFRSQFLHN